MIAAVEAPELAVLEETRLAEQRRLDASTSREARNELGQFATPPALADDIAKAAAAFCNGGEIRFLEPAVGTGAFFSALLRNFPIDRIREATGVELDPEAARVAERLWQEKGLKVLNADFTNLGTNGHQAAPNLILANPPYVRHHHICNQEKTRLQKLASQVVGTSASGLSGLYSYFVLCAHQWLAEDGVAAWLIPAEFMDVNYGETLRRYLSQHVTLLQLHRFDPADVQFADALVSSAVVIYRKRKPSADHEAQVSHGGSVADPAHRSSVGLSRLRNNGKWSRLFADDRIERAEPEYPLSTLFDIKRGIATGANQFFILPRRELADRGIDERFVKPILPPARLLEHDVIASDSSGFPAISEPLAIIDTNLPLDEIEQSCIGLWKYLKQGEDETIPRGYLLTKRSPWYRQEQRPPAPFLCTYMGRKKENGQTFRFFWNQSSAIAANTYLLLYPTGPLKAALNQKPELGARVHELLKQMKPEEVTSHGRVYGGGLFKVEPKELGRVDAGRIVEELHLRVATQRTLPGV